MPEIELSREQIRGITFYEEKGNVFAAEYHRRICDSVLHNANSLSTVETLCRKFRSKDLTFEDATCCDKTHCW